MNSIQVSRFIVSFAWIYHGLFPKLVWVAPVEKAMTASLGLSEDTSYWITKFAGISEIILGVCIFIYYRNKHLILANILFLASLFIFVAISMPVLLIEAFNPVTTNLALIGLSCVLIQQSDEQSE